MEQVPDLAPGTALDVGSGEGADAIWLASQGWQVTGVDVSTVALERAARRAAGAGVDIAARILFFTAEQVAATLDPDSWEIVLAATLARRARDPEGRQVTIHDAVLHARRLAA